MRKKVKKVIKGLEKASKTHAKQAKVLKSGLKVFKARGGMDASRADFTSPSGGVSGASKGPAGGASAGGNYGGNRNPSQTYGGGGRDGGGTTKKTKTTRTIGGLEFKEGTPPLGTSDHLDNPVIAIEVKSGGMAGKKSGPPPKSGPTPHGMKKGGIAKGCGKVMGDRRKVTKYY